MGRRFQKTFAGGPKISFNHHYELRPEIDFPNLWGQLSRFRFSKHLLHAQVDTPGTVLADSWHLAPAYLASPSPLTVAG